MRTIPALRSGIAAATITSMAIPASVPAQRLTVVTGIVRNAVTRDPVANATVTAVHEGWKYVTDGDGRYRLTVYEGRSEVRVTAFGFIPLSRTLLLAAGASHVADFDLHRGAVHLDEVVTMGTRARERTATESAVPVDVISSQLLESTGALETWQQLQRLVPSVNAPHTPVSDNGARPITLRGLAPQHALVLVNGKRRHPAAVLLGQQPSGVANSGFTDLNAIPSSAIDHVEILRDGASAQYGSDAIGGVVNVVLKSGRRRDLRTSIGQVFSSDGGRSHRDGRVADVDATLGMLSRTGAHLTFSGQLRHRGGTNRAYPDYRQQYFTGDSRNDDPPRVSSWLGDSEINDLSFSIAGAVPIRATGEAYAFVGAADRNTVTLDGFFRRPLSERTVRSIFSNGFLPEIETKNRDMSLSVGFRGGTLHSHWDISTGWGSNRVAYHVDESNNPSMGAASPTSFYIGRVGAEQWTSNIDASRDLKVGPLEVLVAAGAELRVEKYRIRSGDDASWSDGGVRILDGPQAGRLAPAGAEGMLGFRRVDAVSAHRAVKAVYLEADGRPFQRLLLQSAARAERYDDFGSTSDGKLAGRLELIRGAAVRASMSTGFRAPALTQQYLSTTRTVPGPPVNGVQIGRLLHTFPVNSDVAKLMGATPLRPETSVNRSAGIVYSGAHLRLLTVDFYQIDIDDRIGATGAVSDTSFVRLFEENGLRGITAGTYFRNNVDTRTRGVDVVASHALMIGPSSVTRVFGGYNHNRTRVTRVVPPPPQLEEFPASQFGRSQRGALEHGQPRRTLTLGVDYSTGRFGLNLNNQRSGPSAQLDMINPDADQYAAAKWITNVRASYRLRPRLEVAINAANLFDVYPTESDGFKDAVDARSESLEGISRYEAALSPFGMNGRTIYVQLSYR
jgi:iron complex outermembrane recepter protein